MAFTSQGKLRANTLIKLKKQKRPLFTGSKGRFLRIKIASLRQYIDMNKIVTFDEMKTRDERESCFPCAKQGERETKRKGAGLR